MLSNRRCRVTDEQAPLGFFDPMGLCRDGDVLTFKRRRETEIKNGRVAMWAVAGYITPEYFKCF
jgi:hypothetical protein